MQCLVCSRSYRSNVPIDRIAIMMDLIDGSECDPICRSGIVRLECQCIALNRLQPVSGIHGSTFNISNCRGRRSQMCILIPEIVRHSVVSKFPRQQQRAVKHGNHRRIILRLFKRRAAGSMSVMTSPAFHVRFMET